MQQARQDDEAKAQTLPELMNAAFDIAASGTGDQRVRLQ
jgi:hypothetical protein